MKYLRIIVLLLLTLTLVIFSVQNAELASIEFLTWSAETSMALLLVISFLLGSFFTFLFLLPALFRKKKKHAPPAPVQPQQVATSKQDKATAAEVQS